MNMDNQNLVWELCETYFSILEISMTSEVSLDQLCSASKIPSQTVEKIVPKNSYDYRIFFLKVLISKIDREVLTELKADIIDDNGPGIPRDKREEVVLPFTRLENSRNIKTGGSGLGLSIAKNSALNHGGELILEDSPLGGLRVRLLLPL